MSEQASVNNFVIRFANVNGTGSASANRLIADTISMMGIPIGPKNMFPSNIQGFPTWYEIRVSERGFTGRRGGVDLLIAMNQQTLCKDQTDILTGGALLYDSSSTFFQGKLRKDINIFPLPVAQLAREQFSNAKTRMKLQNMIYVGAISWLLAIDRKLLYQQIEQTYNQRQELLDLNLQAVRLGTDYAQSYFQALPFYLKKTKRQQEKIMCDGNTALSYGALFAGATVVGWYPITPSTSVIESFAKHCQKWRKNPEDQRKYAIVQAEDEIAALGIVMGATWMGARAFTATSGPGLSLMTELLGYAYYAEVPAVIFAVQRCGPSTGMPTRNQQSDLLQCAYASHGDTRHPILLPGTVQECFSFAINAFDLADVYQTPVFVLSDIELGMNAYLSDPFVLPEKNQPRRGLVLGENDFTSEKKPFHRYVDPHGDGICSRTYPGQHPDGAYFTRGSGHDRLGRYTEDPDLYKENCERLQKKFITLTRDLPEPILTQRSDDKSWAILHYGSTMEPLHEALTLLSEDEIPLDDIRIRAFPFASSVTTLLDRYDRLILVEQNREAQMLSLLRSELGVAKDKIISLCEYGGLPLTANFLVKKIAEQILPAFNG